MNIGIFKKEVFVLLRLLEIQMPIMEKIKS